MRAMIYEGHMGTRSFGADSAAAVTQVPEFISRVRQDKTLEVDFRGTVRLTPSGLTSQLSSTGA